MTLIRIYLLSTFAISFQFFGYGQPSRKSSELTSWVRIPITDSLRNKLISFDNTDLVQTIYQLSIDNHLAVFFDSTSLGNETKWSNIPITILVPNRDSSEIQVVDYRRQAMTLYNSSSEPMKDLYGNPITIFEDGLERYVFAPPTEIPVKAINLFEIEILYSIRYNKRKKTYFYQPVGLGLGIIGKSQSIWIDIKEFKKVYKRWAQFPIFKWMEENNNLKNQYMQHGSVPLPNNENLAWKRINIEANQAENLSLFSNDKESTESFVDYIFNLLDVGALEAYLCYNNEHWQIAFNYSSEKFYADYLSYDSLIANSRIRIKSRDLIYKDTTLIIDGISIDTNFHVLEEAVYFYLNKSEIKALHIIEKAIKDDAGKLKPISVAFVINKDGEKFELFHINLQDIIEIDPSFIDSSWYSFLCERKYIGSTYWQLRHGDRFFRN